MGIICLVMNFKILRHLALLLCWELHWLYVFDSVLQPPSFYYGLSAFSCDNVFITPHPSGQMEIIPPSGPIIPPSACIIPPLGRLDLRSTASLRRDNAGLRRNNGVLRRNNFHCPSGWGVIISQSHCTRRGRRFDFNFQQKFQQNSKIICSYFHKINKRKKSVEGTSLETLEF